MKFSKRGSWKDNWLFELLPRVSYKPLTVTHSYSTDKKMSEDGFKGYKRVGPITANSGRTLTFAWLWSSFTLQWDDSRELTEEEAVEFEKGPQ